MSEPKRRFQALEKSLSKEEIEELEGYAAEAAKESEESGHLRDFMGLKAMGATPEGVRAAIGIGIQFVRQGLLVRAAEYFSGLLWLEPFNPDLYLWMGLTAQKLRRFEQAVKCYRYSIAVGEEQGLAHAYMGEVLLVLGQKDEGVGHLKEGIAKLKRGTKNKKVLLRAEKMLAAHGGP